MWTEKEQKERELSDAKADLTLTDAAIVLASNNDLACEIHLAGIKVGVCNNKKVLPALKHHKKEIEKYLKGQKSEYAD